MDDEQSMYDPMRPVRGEIIRVLRMVSATADIKDGGERYREIQRLALILRDAADAMESGKYREPQ